MAADQKVVIVDDPAFDELIDRDAQLERIGEGYEFSEGPVWNQREQALYFSDIPGDRRWQWTAAGGMKLVATPTFKGNGLAFDIDGSLLVCEQVSSCLTRIHADGRRELVAWHRDGLYLNSPNDVVVRALDGSI
ncbi:MAG: SMP-30/gluconolactonase/LRE family protein, partial [Acidimicrobiales bacterium]|nr:SMP-30/gluconolactonase/LRE family protein [Acidimicrobiales bacterium]